MASTAGTCNSFKTEVLAGTHVLATDTIKVALYTSTAAMTPSTTTAYSATNEVSGTGYSAGGATASGCTIQLNTNTGSVTWSNVTWAASTITARYALVYNSSKSNKAIAILDFGGDIVSTGDTFTVVMPAASAGLINLT